MFQFPLSIFLYYEAYEHNKVHEISETEDKIWLPKPQVVGSPTELPCIGLVYNLLYLNIRICSCLRKTVFLCRPPATVFALLALIDLTEKRQRGWGVSTSTPVICTRQGNTEMSPNGAGILLLTVCLYSAALNASVDTLDIIKTLL